MSDWMNAKAQRGPLFHLDRGARRLQLLLGLVCRLLVDPLQDRLRCAVDEVLGLLQAQARQRPNLLDHLDLLLARAREHHVELRLLLGLLAAPLTTGARCGHHDRTGRGGLHVEGLLELLDEVRELQERHLPELLEQRVRVRLLRRHDHSSPPSEALASGGSAPASSPGGTFSLYASSSDRNRPWRAWNMPAALDISALRAPASLDSMTSRDSSSARPRASSAPKTRPSMNAPFRARAGNRFPASTTLLAAATGSPATKATAVGPSKSRSSSPTPAS